MPPADTLATYVMPNYGRYDVWPVRGEGSRVWDREGKSYLDFASGVSVCPLGHSHPVVIEAMIKQARTLMHVSNWYCIEGQAELAKMLVENVVGIPGKCFFSNSGAEANEGMLKLARRYGHTRPCADGKARRDVVSFTGSFHGRTLGAMFATAQEKIHGGFGFIPAELGHVYATFNDIAALEAAITPSTVAILLEPIQGESGVNAATPDFLRAAQRLCRQHDLLFLLDEVQCSFGRAGEMAGWRSIIPGDEISPDAVSWAKAIGSGYPLGAFWVKDRAMSGDAQSHLCDLLGPGTHGTTYGGSPLACAVGLATVGTILNEDLCGNAKHLGQHIAAVVRGWQHPLIREVRQLGLFIGYELNTERLAQHAGLQASGKPASIYLAKALLDAGLMTVPAGPSVIRWLPPLNITLADADEALALMKGVLDGLM